MLDKIFSKKYIYSHFSNGQINKNKIGEKEFKSLSLKDFKEDIEILNNLYISLNKLIDNIPSVKISALNIKFLNILKIEVNSALTNINNLKSDNDRKSYYEFFTQHRELYKSYISLTTNQSWQSPDFGYSINPQHGINQEKIYSFYNDYQRYRANTVNFEKVLNDELPDIQGAKKRSFIFNSGMGGFSTLLKSLPEFSTAKKIAGKNLYFEVISLLKYYENIEFIDETDDQQIISLINKNKPKFLFFDIVANSPKLTTFKIEKLFEYYKKSPPETDTFIIIDVSLNFNLVSLNKYFKDIFPEKLNIILYRSLQKLDQYGFDMVSGGLVTHYGNSSLDLESYRQMGTTPTEIEVSTLENIERIDLKKIFFRHSRNALIMADYLKSFAGNIISKVHHPLLDISNKSEIYQIPLFFFYLNREFNLEDNNFFIRSILAQAKQKNLNIILGTSFGFTYSRLMITTDINETCIRFAAGRETLEEVFALKEVFNNVITNFLSDLKNAYENLELELFRGKSELFEDKISKVVLEKSFSREAFENLSFLLMDISQSLVKFKSFRETKNFYLEKMDSFFTKMLDLTNKPDISVDEEIKKDIIRLISKLFS